MSAGRLPLLSIVGLAACTAHHDIGAVRFTQTMSRDVDVLVVVDDSLSSNALPGLARDFPAFAEAIQASASSLHIGFITSDMGGGTALPCKPGENGVFESNVQCSASPVISSEASMPSAPASFADALVCLFPTRLGCPLQQPFAAVKAALDRTSGTAPPQFLRESADLVVVFFAGRDDCSLSPGSKLFDAPDAGVDAGTSGSTEELLYRCAESGVQCNYQPLPATLTTFSPVSLPMCQSSENGQDLLTVADTAEFLFELKDDIKQVFVVVVAGPTAPFTINMSDATNPTVEASCQGNAVTALPPVRLQELTEKLRSNGISTSICGVALASQLANAGRSVAARTRCLSGMPRMAASGADGGADTDAGAGGNGGIPLCDVTYATVTDAGATDLTIPACAAGQPPCFRLVQNAAECPGSGLEIDLVPGPSPLPPGSFIVDCLGTPSSE